MLASWAGPGSGMEKGGGGGRARVFTLTRFHKDKQESASSSHVPPYSYSYPHHQALYGEWGFYVWHIHNITHHQTGLRCTTKHKARTTSPQVHHQA